MSSTAQLSAKERILALVDEHSFVEVGAYVTKRSTDFNLQQKEVPADGVITGYGVINGKLVYVYSQDVTSMKGTVGEMHAKKICQIYNLALKVGAPVIGLIDCAGFRLQEATDALNAFGELYVKKTMASGILPQITGVFGTCGGGSTILASLSDFIFMEKQNGRLFVNSPNTLENNHRSKCDTSSATYCAEAGLVDVLGEDEASVLQSIRDLIQILPSNHEDNESFDECLDDLNRELTNFQAIKGDGALALKEISDNGFFYEVKSNYAKEMVTGFIRLNGATVGAIANRTVIMNDEYKTIETFDGSLTTAGCEKAEKFVRFCDAFQLPILTLTNVTGYKATMEEEKTIGKASAKLTYAFANATVPKVNLILEKAYGSAYVTMNSKHIGADLVFALSDAKIGMMEASAAAEIIYSEEIKNAQDKVAFLKEKAKEYDQLQSSAMSAARRGYVDNIIEGLAVRKQLIYAFEMLFTKRESRLPKKHGSF